jgi:hypothetical protein
MRDQNFGEAKCLTGRADAQHRSILRFGEAADKGNGPSGYGRIEIGGCNPLFDERHVERTCAIVGVVHRLDRAPEPEM